MPLPRYWCVASVALALVVLGCGEPLPIPVSGVVTVDGQTVPDVVVTFVDAQDATKKASGRTDAQGRYRLGTKTRDDGAFPGEYKVLIAKAETLLELGELGGLTSERAHQELAARKATRAGLPVMGKESPPKGKTSVEKPIDYKFGIAERTPLTASVAPGRTEFRFEVSTIATSAAPAATESAGEKQ